MHVKKYIIVYYTTFTVSSSKLYLGGTVASHQEGPKFKSRLSQEAFLCGVFMFSGCSVFLTIQKHAV